MAVFRIEKTRDYTVMSDHHLKDRTLTLKSKGLLSMMLPFSSRSCVRRIYPWVSSSFNAAPMLSTPSRQIAARPLVV